MATSSGQGEVVDLFNTGAAPLVETVTLNWTYALTALAAAPETASAFASFSFDDVLGAAPMNLFAFNKAIQAPPNSAAPPPNPAAQVFILTIPKSVNVGGVLMPSDKLRIDPMAGGTADTPEPGTIILALVGLGIVALTKKQR
jgi:hypothetical protein